VAVVVLSAVACVGIWRWFGARSPVLERTGAIVVASKERGLSQRDTWRFYASAREARASAAWVGMTIPFFEERGQRRASRIALVCDGAGEPVSFDFRLAPGLKVGLLTRRIERWRAPEGMGSADAEHPLAFQLGRAYLNRPVAIKGQAAAEPVEAAGANTEVWPTLVVE
jgi:hypothetical protein